MTPHPGTSKTSSQHPSHQTQCKKEDESRTAIIQTLQNALRFRRQSAVRDLAGEGLFDVVVVFVWVCFDVGNAQDGGE